MAATAPLRMEMSPLTVAVGGIVGVVEAEFCVTDSGREVVAIWLW